MCRYTQVLSNYCEQAGFTVVYLDDIEFLSILILISIGFLKLYLGLTSKVFIQTQRI